MGPHAGLNWAGSVAAGRLRNEMGEEIRPGNREEGGRFDRMSTTMLGLEMVGMGLEVHLHPLFRPSIQL